MRKLSLFILIFILSSCASKLRPPKAQKINDTTVILMPHDSSDLELQTVDFYSSSAISGTFTVGTNELYFGHTEGESLHGINDYQADLMINAMVEYGRAHIAQKHFTRIPSLDIESTKFIASMISIESMVENLQYFIHQDYLQKGKLFDRAFNGNNPLAEELNNKTYLKYIHENMSPKMFAKIYQFYQDIIIYFIGALEFSNSEVIILNKFLEAPLNTAYNLSARDIMFKKSNELLADNITHIYNVTQEKYFFVPMRRNGMDHLIEKLREEKVRFQIRELMRKKQNEIPMLD